MSARFEYKCRLCGEVYSDSGTSKEKALMILVGVVLGTEIPLSVGTAPLLLDIHCCNKTHSGVADLLGYSTEEN